LDFVTASSHYLETPEGMDQLKGVPLAYPLSVLVVASVADSASGWWSLHSVGEHQDGGWNFGVSVSAADELVFYSQGAQTQATSGADVTEPGVPSLYAYVGRSATDHHLYQIGANGRVYVDATSTTNVVLSPPTAANQPRVGFGVSWDLTGTRWDYLTGQIWAGYDFHVALTRSEVFRVARSLFGLVTPWWRPVEQVYYQRAGVRT
jgi:hypothetical protein